MLTADELHQKLRYDNTSGIKGVVFRADMGRWIARCGRRHVGTFKTADEARSAYHAAATALYGEYAREG